MKIYRAVKPNKITQRFGENPGLYERFFGMKGHNGIDWRAPVGEKIYWDCSIRGKVIRLMTDEKLGWGVYVITEENNEIFQHRFWHLCKISCQVGQTLESGTLIGLADTTGYAWASHLHRDLKPMVKDANGNYKKKYPKNGYFGAIDYMPYLENVFIKDYVGLLLKQVSLLQHLIAKIQELLKVGKK